MARFQFGEKLVCLKKVKVNSRTYPPGSDFDYEGEDLNLDLIESLMDQRKLASKDKFSDAQLASMRKEKVAKRIRNFKDGRVAVSWPWNEPLPEGVVDGRVKSGQIRPGMFDKPEKAKEETVPEVSEDISIPKIEQIGETDFYNVILEDEIINAQGLTLSEAEGIIDDYKKPE